MTDELDQYKIAVETEMLPLSKREAIVIADLHNRSNVTYAKIAIDKISISGTPVTIVNSKPVRDLQPNQTAELEVEVVLPSNVPFDFGADSTTAQAEIVFYVSSSMSKETYEALPEWRD